MLNKMHPQGIEHTMVLISAITTINHHTCALKDLTNEFLLWI